MVDRKSPVIKCLAMELRNKKRLGFPDGTHDLICEQCLREYKVIVENGKIATYQGKGPECKREYL
ncbi:hypothetical protein HY310_01475 [Candidatus Microgenomates bacterium]|nr:hypothetical protein [Candidatus Microgenomates bacterium]